MTKLKLLDLQCGAGGASWGYHLAGFDVVGVDIKYFKRYPFQMIVADGVQYLKEHGSEYDVIHVSPVCKKYTVLSALYPDREYPDQVAQYRELLDYVGKPYIIENVPGAPLENYVTLCGTMFDLRVYRHRLFECKPRILTEPAECNHWGRASGNKASKRIGGRIGNLIDHDILTITGHDFIAEDGRKAMEIPWMSRDELSQAVPPAYTKWIGEQIKELIGV